LRTSTTTTWSIFGRERRFALTAAGIDLEFKVSKAVSIMLEGNANMISDKYNSKKEDNPDWYFNALAGVRINLGKSYTKKAKPVEEPAPAPAPKQEYVAPKPASSPSILTRLLLLRMLRSVRWLTS
jgi:hypothetical protein